MNRWMVAVLCGSVAVGCGASSNDPQVTIDSGVTPADTGSTTTTDNGSTTVTDRGSTTTTDRGSTTTDSGTASQYGSCGVSLHNALCACGTDMTCQQTAQMNAINTAGACQTCYGNAQTGCCPTQYQAILTCAQAMGCADSACAQMMCPTQVQTFLTCFQNGVQNDTACQARIQTCFGSEFPQLNCAM